MSLLTVTRWAWLAWPMQAPCHFRDTLTPRGKMDTSKDYYLILEVHPKASAEIIERAKRVLLQRYHPDKNPDRAEWAGERTRLVLEAYGALSNPEIRAEYDERRRGCASSAKGRSPRARASRRSGSGPARTRSGYREREVKLPDPRESAASEEIDVPPGFRAISCARCGRRSRVGKGILLYRVICGACGEPLRPRLSRRAKQGLRRIDDRLERMRDGLVSVLEAVGIRALRRKKEKSSP